MLGCIPARVVLAVLNSIAMAIIYGLKSKLSVAIVSMVNHTANYKHQNDTIEKACPTANGTEGTVEDGPFAWDDVLQGIILGSYFWGYLLSQLPGGRIAELISARWVMFAAVASNIVCTILSPVASYMHSSFLIVLRVIMGLGGGLTFPASHVLIASWTPPKERTIMSSVIYSGTSLGTVLAFPLTGLITSWLGWEASFYIQGALSLIWCVLWIVLVRDSPEESPWISDEEKSYIRSSLQDSKSKSNSSEMQKLNDPTGDIKVTKKSSGKFPFRGVFTSVPFYAILIAHFLGNISWYMLLLQLPIYMKQILGFDIKSNSALSALPYISAFIFQNVVSVVLGTLRKKDLITTTTARKTATGISTLVPFLCFAAVTYAGCNATLAVALLSISVMTMSAMFVGHVANHIDIAPNFAGTLVAITNTVATIPGITVPIIIGYLTQGNQTFEAWRNIYYGIAVTNILQFLIYTIFASGEEQPWQRTE